MKFKGIFFLLIVGSVLLASGCVSSGQQSSQPTTTASIHSQTPVVTSYFVSFTVERSSTNGDIVVTNKGGTGANSLKTVKISFVDNTGATVGPDTCSNLTSKGVSGSLDTVGSSSVIAKSNAASPSHVIVTGTFKDDTVQVLTVADV